MKIGDFFKSVGGLIVTGLTKLCKLAMNADLGQVIKAGLFIGATVITLVSGAKVVRNKMHVYKDESKMTTVDRALALNYADKRNRDSLDPLMREVKKNLAGHSTRNKKLKSGSKYFKAIMRGMENSYRDSDPYVLNELEKFKQDMEEIAEEEKARASIEDNFVLRRAWNEI